MPETTPPTPTPTDPTPQPRPTPTPRPGPQPHVRPVIDPVKFRQVLQERLAKVVANMQARGIEVPKGLIDEFLAGAGQMQDAIASHQPVPTPGPHTLPPEKTQTPTK